MISVGKCIKHKINEHPGNGAGTGTIVEKVFECPCGEGTFTDVYDNIPGFKEHDYRLDCVACYKKYSFDPISGRIEERK